MILPSVQMILPSVQLVGPFMPVFSHPEESMNLTLAEQ